MTTLRQLTHSVAPLVLLWAPYVVAADDAAIQRSVFLTDGSLVMASLDAIRPDGSLELTTPDGPRRVAVAELIRWGEYQDSYRDTQVYLADGSVLTADVLEMDDAAMQIYGDVCGAAKLPFADVRGIIFDPPMEDLERDRLVSRMFAATGSDDLLLFENGDAVAGNIQGLINFVDANDETVTAVTLTAESREVQIPIDKLSAVVFDPRNGNLARAADRRLTLGFSDGTLLHVARIEDHRSLVDCYLAGQVRLRVDPEVLIQEATYLLPENPRVIYLSDLATLAYKQVPLLQTPWPLGRDRNVLGGYLRSHQCAYAKGLGMHATARVAVALDGSYQRFQAEVALDDQAGLDGSVIFRVFVLDAAGNWLKALESPVVRGSDPPLPISVDLTNARSIALIVDAADRGDVQDHANWLYARLVR